MQNINFVISPELQRFIPELTTEEYNRLEANILAEGIRDALVVWTNPETQQRFLIDGHNRYTIAQRNGIDNFDIKTVELKIPLANIDEVKEWMINKQLGQRNLTEEIKAYFRGVQYQLEKKRVGKHKIILGNDYPIKGTTKERLAEQHKLSPKTIGLDSKFSQALDKIGEIDNDIKWAILNRDILVHKESIYKVFEAGKVKEFVENLQLHKDAKKAIADIFPAELQKPTILEQAQERIANTTKVETLPQGSLNNPKTRVQANMFEEVKKNTNPLKPHPINRELREPITPTAGELEEILDILDDSVKAKALAYIDNLKKIIASAGFEGLHQAHEKLLEDHAELKERYNKDTLLIIKLDTQIKPLNETNYKLSEENNTLKKEIAELKYFSQGEENRDLVGTVKTLREQNEALQKELKVRDKVYDEKGKEQSAEVSKLNKQIFVLEAEIEKLKAQPKATRNPLSVYDLELLATENITVFRLSENEMDVNKYSNGKWVLEYCGETKNKTHKYLKEKIEGKINLEGKKNIILWNEK